MEFKEIIRTREELRAIIPPNNGKAQFKEIDHLDDICRRYIAAAPFLIIGSKGGDNLMDLSPKGDPAGFVQVLDDHTLVIPERPGNRRCDTFENILVNPEVGLIFLIPGNNDTLRVCGDAFMVRDLDLRQRFEINGKIPELCLVVKVKGAMTHCPKCMYRSSLWKPEGWPDLSNVPTLAEGMTAHAKITTQNQIDLTVEQMQEIIDNDGKYNMY